MKFRVNLYYYSIAGANILLVFSIIGLVYGALVDGSFLGISLGILVVSLPTRIILGNRSDSVLDDYLTTIDQLTDSFVTKISQLDTQTRTRSTKQEFKALESHYDSFRQLALLVDNSERKSQIDQVEADLYRALIAHVKDNPELQYSSNIADMFGFSAFESDIATLEEVGDIRRERLESAGLGTRLAIYQADIDTLTDVDSIGPKTARKLKNGISPYPILDKLEKHLDNLDHAPDGHRGEGQAYVEREEYLKIIGSTRKKPHHVGDESSSESQMTGENQEESSEYSEEEAKAAKDTEGAKGDRITQSNSSTPSKSSASSVDQPSSQDTGLVDTSPQIELQSALETLQNAKSDDESRNELIRAHNHLCRALDAYERIDADIEKEKIEVAITEIEERLQDDGSDTREVEPSTSDIDGDKNGPETGISSSNKAPVDGEAESGSSEHDRAELIAEIQRLSDEQGNVVSRGSMWSIGSFDPGDYEDVFGSWEAALEEAGVLDETGGEGETETDDEETSVEEEGNRSLDQPEGRISSLEIIVKEIEEFNDTARDRELTVETAEGVELPFNIWNQHDVDRKFEIGEHYLIEQSRYQTWDTENDADNQLSSTSDLKITDLGRLDWLSAVRLELHRYRLDRGDEVLRLDDIYRFSEHRLGNKFPDNNNIRPKIRQILQRLRERGEVQFVDDQGTYRIIELDGFPAVEDHQKRRDQTSEAGEGGVVENDTRRDQQDHVQPDVSSGVAAEAGGEEESTQIDQFLDDLDL